MHGCINPSSLGSRLSNGRYRPIRSSRLRSTIDIIRPTFLENTIILFYLLGYNSDVGYLLILLHFALFNDIQLVVIQSCPIATTPTDSGEVNFKRHLSSETEPCQSALLA
jgi:hypothetical protein